MTTTDIPDPDGVSQSVIDKLHAAFIRINSFRFDSVDDSAGDPGKTGDRFVKNGHRVDEPFDVAAMRVELDGIHLKLDETRKQISEDLLDLRRDTALRHEQLADLREQMGRDRGQPRVDVPRCDGAQCVHSSPSLAGDTPSVGAGRPGGVEGHASTPGRDQGGDDS